MVLFLLILFLFLPILIWFFVPVGFTIHSLWTLYRLPGQFLQIARDRRRRRNHALEHATVNVLEEQAGRSLRVGGFAEPDGFFLQGVSDPQVVLKAAREGLRRLQAGEPELALHPRCGTTLVAAQGIGAISFLAILLLAPRLSLIGIGVALLFAMWLARPVSLFLQRTLTTSTDVANLTVDTVERDVLANPVLVLFGGGAAQFKVRTRETAAADDAARRAPRKRYRAY